MTKLGIDLKGLRNTFSLANSSQVHEPNAKNRLPRPHRYHYVPWQYTLLSLAIVLVLGITSLAIFMYQSSIHTQPNPNTHLAKIPTRIQATHTPTPNSSTPTPTPNSSTPTPAPDGKHSSANQPPTPTQVPPTTAPAPTPTPVPAPQTYAEQEGGSGANTFTNPYNASGMGTKIAAATWVQVSCKVYAPAIQSANPDGYWYRIASSPWNNAYYAVANTFKNGDSWTCPCTHNTDFSVPNC
jgi:cytoskeletal protein RodZ